MSRKHQIRLVRGSALVPVVALTVLGLFGGRARSGEDASAPKQAEAAAANDDAATAAALKALEERLRKLEEANRSILDENKRLRRQYETLNQRFLEREAGRNAGGLNVPSGSLPEPLVGDPDTSTEGGAGARDNPAGSSPVLDEGAGGPDLNPLFSPSTDPDVSSEGGAGARDNPADIEPGRVLRSGTRTPLKVYFGPGFEFASPDDEFQLQFHNETQPDFRLFGQSGQTDAHSGFYLPRQIWYLTGRLTKPLEFYTAFQKGLGSVNVRDAFINIHYDDRAMLKVGRYKPPFTYEFYAISNQDLMSPERSLFALNYGDNRELGLMGWGRLFTDRLDYAVGVFNGPRNSFEDFNDAQDITAYLNAHPFAQSESLEFLKHFNIGGSVDFGNQNNPLLPDVLRTASSASTSDGARAASPAFLAFNPTIFESGLRELWNLHLAYFYNGLSLLAEWDDGYTEYAPIAAPLKRTRVPIQGYYVQAGYFLTGESVPRRTQVEVLRPFNLRREKFGLGAFEIHGRYSTLRLGNNVFTAGLADPTLWTDNVYTTDVGLNWYLNRYLKIYLDWQHAVFGDPVFFAPGRFQKTSDLYWLRFQLYF